MTDALLERLTVEPESVELGSIPWPGGLAPQPFQPDGQDGAMPPADVLIVTYTTAEAEALADVFTPGVHRTEWLPYTKNWNQFEGQLTNRSPARHAKCMAHYWGTMIADKRVIVAKSELHLSTDGKSMPVCELFKQMVADVSPSLVITTGTAGGVGIDEVLGDVIVGAGVKFNLAKSPWANEPYAQRRFVATAGFDGSHPGVMALVFSTLIPAAIGDRLKPSGYASRAPWLVTGKDIETVGYFAFADTADSYGVVKNDPNAGCEEMDDACVGLALSQLEHPPAWAAIRNASDPQMGGGSLPEQKKQAAAIYRRYGYYTTVCSALVCWAVIAGM